MSRRKTKPEDVKNPEHYFNKYIAKEVLNDQREKDAYYDFFDSLDELIEERKIEQLLYDRGGTDFDPEMASSSFFAWIEQIQNENLYDAILKISERDKTLLTLRYQYLFTQRETAVILGVSQFAVSKREHALKKYFRKFLENGFQKRRF